MSRRDFVIRSAGGLITAGLAPAPPGLPAQRTASNPSIKAIAFDAFAVFDPSPVFVLADALFPGAGLSAEWRTRQFEYTWLRVAAQNYADFWQVTEDALVFAANKLRLRLTADDRIALMNGYLRLKVWPDAVPALESIRKSGIRLALLSNFTQPMLDANIANAGLDGMFDHVLSTDRHRTYKPDRYAYQLGLDAFKMARQEIMFAAFAGWDAAGARLFGYPTYWVNRQRLPVEELGVLPDVEGGTLTDLARYLMERAVRNA